MLRVAQMAASTSRTAALGRHGQWPQWAIHVDAVFSQCQLHILHRLETLFKRIL
jgi:hypothetical protein